MVNILMQTYQTVTEYNASGADGLLLYVNHIWPGFTPMLLFVFFMIALTTTMFAQRRISGNMEFVPSLAVASFVTFVLATMMTVIDGLINTFTLAVCFILTVVSVMWLLLSNDRGF